MDSTTIQVAEPIDVAPSQRFLLRSRLGLMQGDADVQTSEENP